MSTKLGKNYLEYVIKDDEFIGAFEELYRSVDDPWHVGDATGTAYDLALYLIAGNGICDRGGNILDIGCGKGAFTARLKQQMPQAHILAVDIAPTAIRTARQKYGDLDIEFRVMNIQKEYASITEQFDLVVMSHVIWYVLPVFRQIIGYFTGNTLKSNGYLLVNQCFCRPEDQLYGKDILSTIEDMVGLIDMEPIDTIELNRSTTNSAVVLFKNAASAI